MIINKTVMQKGCFLIIEMMIKNSNLLRGKKTYLVL